MKKSTLQIKKYLFLTILTTSSIVACLIIYFCIFEKSKEFRKKYGEMEKTVLVLHNQSFTEKGSGKKLFMKYEDMLEIIGIVRRCNNVSEIILEYLISVEHSENVNILLRNKKRSTAANRGVSVGYDKLMGLTIKEGRFFRKEDEENEVCVILQNLAKKLDAKVSDTLKYMGKELKIIGIVAEEKPFDVNIAGPLYEVYLPIKTKRQLHENKETYTEGMLSIESSKRKPYPYIRAYLMYNSGKRELTYQEVTNLLENKYGKDKEFSLGEEHTPLFGLEFYKILWTIGLFLIVGISILINKKSLSAFLSLTYSNKDQLFLVKTCLLTGMSGVLGVVFGGIISPCLMIEPKISIFSIFVSLSIGIIFGLLVAIRTIRKLMIEVKK